MSSYVLSTQAEQDLAILWEYIAEDSIEAADRLVDRLFEAFDQIALVPGMGHSRDDLTSLPILFWPVDKYLVIYRAHTSMVEVVAVVHGSRDVPSFLRRL